MITSNETGIGLEAEYLIVNSEGIPVPRIDEIPSIDWVIEKFIGQIKNGRKSMNGLLDMGMTQSEAEEVMEVPVSREEFAAQLEVKTLKVHESMESALKEIQEHIARVNEILKERGLEARGFSVSEKPFEYVPPASSRGRALWERWSRLFGRDEIWEVVIEGIQTNNSTLISKELGFEAKLTYARHIMNAVGNVREELIALGDSGRRDFRGFTRLENIRKLMTTVKGQSFEQFNGIMGTDYSAEDIIIPPHFGSNDEFLLYLAAHCCFNEGEMKSQAGKILNRDPDVQWGVITKNTHPITTKVKMSNDPKKPWIVEVRTLDNRENPEEQLRVLKATHELIDPAISREIAAANKGRMAIVA